MQVINPKSIIQQRLATSFGLDIYASIMKTFRNVDVSKDEDFQRKFNHFYRVRRNEEWRSSYYDLFESIKNRRNPTFDLILDTLLEQTGNIEASFSSKMLATIDSGMPIWDHYVIENLGIKIPAQSDPERVNKVKIAYAEMVDWYANFLNTENARECINEFDKMLPSYSWISDVKKIDFFIFSIR